MKHRAPFDIDQWLIFLLLAVTVNQLAAYLDRYTGTVLAYLQAGAIDLAIWRCGFWYRRYTGPKQRRLALLGLVAFSLVSAWYNRNFYHFADPSLPAWQCWLMGAILPLGVALLSYLYGTKDASRFSTTKDSEAESTKLQPTHTPDAIPVQPDATPNVATKEGMIAYMKTKTQLVRELAELHPDWNLMSLATYAHCSVSTASRALASDDDHERVTVQERQRE